MISIDPRFQLNRQKLISKWKDKISERDEVKLFRIINSFNIGFYKINDFMPTNKSYFYTKKQEPYLPIMCASNLGHKILYL